MTAEERKEAERVINEMIAESVKRKTYEIRMNEYRELIKLILIRDTPRAAMEVFEQGA